MHAQTALRIGLGYRKETVGYVLQHVSRVFKHRSLAELNCSLSSHKSVTTTETSTIGLMLFATRTRHSLSEELHLQTAKCVCIQQLSAVIDA